MLPKFSNLFARTSYGTFKQGFFSSTSSTSSTSGSAGGGAGGASGNAGSRFYYQYTGGRVTQSGFSTTSSNSSPNANNNDEERTTHNSLRWTKLTTPSVQQRAGSYRGILTHPHLTTDNIKSSSAPTRTVQQRRRNSTSTATYSEVTHDLPPFPPVTPETSLPPDSRRRLPAARENTADRSILRLLGQKSPDPKKVHAAFREYRGLPKEEQSLEGHNAILKVLLSIRSSGAAVTPIVRAYNQLLALGFLPDGQTYSTVLEALITREAEVHVVAEGLRDRIQRREVFGSFDADNLEADDGGATDVRRLQELEKEDNFSSAVIVHQALFALPRTPYHDLSEYIHRAIFQSCATHKNLPVAQKVFSTIARNKRTPIVYASYLSVFAAVGDQDGGKQVFDEFRSSPARFLVPKSDPNKEREISRVYSEMIKCYFSSQTPSTGPAVELLEQMMNASISTKANPKDGPAVPRPFHGSYTAIVKGFLDAGDYPTAIAWFRRLVDVTEEEVEGGIVTRPSDLLWGAMIDSLSLAIGKGGSEELLMVMNNFWLERPGTLRVAQRIAVIRANLSFARRPEVPVEKKKEIADFLQSQVVKFIIPPQIDGAPSYPWNTAFLGASTQPLESLPGIAHTRTAARELIVPFVDLFVQIGDYDRAISNVLEWTRVRETMIEGMVDHDSSTPLRKLPEDAQRKLAFKTATHLSLNQLVSIILAPKPASSAGLTLQQAMAFGASLLELGHVPSQYSAPYYTKYYVQARQQDPDAIKQLDFVQLSALLYFAGVPSITRSVKVLRSGAERYPDLPVEEWYLPMTTYIEDAAKLTIDPQGLYKNARRTIFLALVTQEGADKTAEFLRKTGYGWETLQPSSEVHRATKSDAPTVKESAATPTTEPLQPVSSITIDDGVSRYIDEYYPASRTVTPLDCYARFEECIAKGLYPRPEIIGRLINFMGRAKELPKVKFLYQQAQIVLASMEGKQEQQSLAWFQVEDQMIIAWAHGGEPDKAFIHRDRILANGGTPSADAYGGLIAAIKDTTDDVQSALLLWNESQTRGVRPNLYLYNTVISRLAKARKADHAIELFKRMKAENVHPSTVTYGAIITACCRVGDVDSAEALFEEMTHAPKYQPRVPPFNTVIQLFTTTKPDRAKVEHYYQLMKTHRVEPSDHTYKLLLDAYGTIHPIQLESMWEVFERLAKDPKVRVNGSHWAALINAYGCAQKDIAGALDVFETIKSHRSTARSREVLPNAVVYEALFNVLVTHHRPDLFESYLLRMRRDNIHMTAYIANLLIKGHAATGNIEEARSMFESLSDPAIGVAAPDNHPPHPQPNGKTDQWQPSPSAPVYREPSTWEAMVRAELGLNNRPEAMALIYRMQQRNYPPAVEARVTGILQEDFGIPDAYSWMISNNLTPSPTALFSPVSDQSTFGGSTPPSSIYKV